MRAISGNAASEAEAHRGWFIGHFLSEAQDPRSTSAVEVKWGYHRAGEEKPIWSMNTEATSLSLLIRGRFTIRLPEEEYILSAEGDYLLWPGGVPHTWAALEDSQVLTIRWPSKTGDTVEFPDGLPVSTSTAQPNT